MQRRELFAYIAGAVALYPFAAECQQVAPEIGFLHQGSPEPASLMGAFSAGLGDSGINPDRDVRIAHRWADGEYDRLPGLAKDLISRRVTVLAANFLPAALAAKAATQ